MVLRDGQGEDAPREKAARADLEKVSSGESRQHPIILPCRADASFHTGPATDPQRRLGLSISSSPHRLRYEGT
jgi:hypothetical protein